MAPTVSAALPTCNKKVHTLAGVDFKLKNAPPKRGFRANYAVYCTLSVTGAAPNTTSVLGVSSSEPSSCVAARDLCIGAHIDLSLQAAKTGNTGTNVKAIAIAPTTAKTTTLVKTVATNARTRPSSGSTPFLSSLIF